MLGKSFANLVQDPLNHGLLNVVVVPVVRHEDDHGVPSDPFPVEPVLDKIQQLFVYHP